LQANAVKWYDLTIMEYSAGCRVQQEFFTRAPRACEILELFEYLPSVCLYVKNRRSQFVKVNAAMYVNYGVADEAALYGKTDRDFHAPALAEAYIAEDRRVMATRRTIPNQVWLVPFFQGTPQWYVSSKTPLFTNNDEVVGIAGVMYPIRSSDRQQAYFKELLPAIRHIEQRFTKMIRMPEVAARAGISATHFNRRFRELLRMSPSDYILLLRVQYAQSLLTEDSESMAQVAAKCGFSDQSHFCKRFRKVTGIAPMAYRNRFRTRPESP
jgi:AraC-like DNA-binding protein